MSRLLARHYLSQATPESGTHPLTELPVIKIVKLEARRDFANTDMTPDGHWVRLTFSNEHGVHTIELNGRIPLPPDPALRQSLEFMLWDYGLIEQVDSRTPQQQIATMQRLVETDLRNHAAGRAYLQTLGAPVH